VGTGDFLDGLGKNICFASARIRAFERSGHSQVAIQPLLPGLLNSGLYTLKLVLNGTFHNGRLSFEENLYSVGGSGAPTIQIAYNLEIFGFLLFYYRQVLLHYVNSYEKYITDHAFGGKDCLNSG
jgi:hypothetical protein